MSEADPAKLLNTIKEEISLIESCGASQSLLDETEQDFNDMLELCKLFLLSERDTYYGHFLMNMQVRTEFRSGIIAGIKLDEYPAVLVSNPLLLGKLSLKEILYVICHEIDHVLYNHPAEMLRSNPSRDQRLFKLFNYAADAAVNDRLDLEISEGSYYIKAPLGIINSNTLSEKFSLGSIRPLESYQYYFDLIKDKDIPEDEPPTPQLIINAAPENNRSSKCGTSEDAESAEEMDHSWGNGMGADELEVAANELVSEVAGIMSEEARGLMPARFISQINRINTPAKISWQSVLKRYIGTISAGKRKTRMRLNRRQPSRFDLSGSMDDKVLKIAVAIDTSASVSDEEIAQFFNEIFAIIARRKHEVTVIECDSEVQRVYKANSAEDIQMIASGRGGTRFTPAIEYVNGNRYFRDSLFIYFTDGFGESDIPRPRTYRNMWVVLGDEHNLSLHNPYGTVMTL